jgi:hypothetical protein
MGEAPHRFPRPWRAEPIPGGHVVRDADGQALAYVYSRENEAESKHPVRAAGGSGQAASLAAL